MPSINLAISHGIYVGICCMLTRGCKGCLFAQIEVFSQGNFKRTFVTKILKNIGMMISVTEVIYLVGA